MDTIVIPQKIIGKRSTGKTDWLYEKNVAKYVSSRINKAEKEFKNGQAVKWKNS